MAPFAPFVMLNRSIVIFGLGASLIFPLYQGVYLKCARFFRTRRKLFRRVAVR